MKKLEFILNIIISNDVVSPVKTEQNQNKLYLLQFWNLIFSVGLDVRFASVRNIVFSAKNKDVVVARNSRAVRRS